MGVHWALRRSMRDAHGSRVAAASITMFARTGAIGCTGSTNDLVERARRRAIVKFSSHLRTERSDPCEHDMRLNTVCIQEPASIKQASRRRRYEQSSLHA